MAQFSGRAANRYPTDTARHAAAGLDGTGTRKLDVTEMNPAFMVMAFALIGGLSVYYYNSRGRIQIDDQSSEGEQQQHFDAYQTWLYEHRTRGLPIEMICDSVPAGFDHDERLLCVLPGIDLLEPRAVRRSIRSGGSHYGGPTIRLARGLSFRLGASRSTGISESESFDELRKIDHGTLVLSTKRLAFLGSLRTNNSSLDDLIGVKDFAAGIQVHRERKQKAETYLLTYPLITDGLAITGEMIQLAIEMAKLAQAIDALEGAPPPAQIVWKKSPFAEDHGNPLQCGSLYERDRG